MNIAALRTKARAMQMVVKPSELMYVLALRKIAKALHTSFVAAMMALAERRRLRLDAEDEDEELATLGWYELGEAGASVEAHFLKQVPAKVGEAFDRMSAKLQADTRRTHTLISIHPSETGIANDVLAARERSIRLVENAGRAYAADVRAVFDDPANFDLSTHELQELLVARGNVSASRAELIARDQTLKLSSAMTKTRQMNAGVMEYVWSGVLDNRERDSHFELEGQKFSWLVQTPIGYHPGEDYQCRCVPIAYTEELDGL